MTKAILQRSDVIVEKDGTPTKEFQISWQRLNKSIIDSIASNPANASLYIRSARVHSPRDTSDVPRYMLIATTTGASSSISVARHDWDYPDGTSTEITRELGVITGLTPDTEYWVAFDDTTLADTNPTYFAVTTAADGENSATNPYRHGLGNIRTPPIGSVVSITGGAQPGVSYQLIGYDSRKFINNFDARNDRISAAIVSATIATDGTAVDHTINDNGSADISVEWSWAGSDADIDGWHVMLLGRSSSSAYTPGATPAAETVFQMPPDKRAFIIYGVQPTLYYTFAVRAFRYVDPDIDPDEIILGSWVKPSLAAENPYRPASNTAFAGDVTGTVGGTAATTVATGVVAANNGLNSDGTVKSGRVLTGSVSNGALVAAGWAEQGSLFIAGPTATDDVVWGSTQATLGNRLVLDVTFNWRMQLSSPTQGSEYYFDVYGILIRQSDLAVIGVGPQRLSVKWQQPTAVGTQYTQREITSLQFTMDGLNLDTYQPGIRVVTSGWSVALEQYRYLKANDLRATQ